MTRSSSEANRLAQAAGAAFARRDFAAAQGFARQLLLLNLRDPNASQILGLIALEQGDAAAAKAHLQRADASAPNQPPILNSLGVALRRLGEADAARAAFKRSGEGGLIDAWRNLGNLEEVARRAEASIAAYKRALLLAPRDPASHAALAQAYERRHELDRARTHALEALGGDPGNEIALLALAHILMRDRDFAGAERAAAAVAANPRVGTANATIAWGLVGEARDKSGDAASAFAAFTAANRILLEQHRALLSAEHLIYHPAGVRRMAALVESADFSAWSTAAAARTPAFLVGFPRSGTTLLDQVLSSHSRIVCIEEREHLANALAAIITSVDKLAALDQMPDAAIEAVRADYWRRVEAEGAAVEGMLVVDKLPLNIVVLPLIHRVFPGAKIIFALRDPRDVVLSCYQQRFGMNAAMAQFLQLESAGAYYDAVMRLMDLCTNRLDLDLRRVRYEDVVADLEQAGRDLVEFLGLEFEPVMLEFRATALKRDINTPSARQVIQPMYKSSVGRWRRYATELAPVLPLLALWARRLGYAD